MYPQKISITYYYVLLSQFWCVLSNARTGVSHISPVTSTPESWCQVSLHRKSVICWEHLEEWDALKQSIANNLETRFFAWKCIWLGNTYIIKSLWPMYVLCGFGKPAQVIWRKSLHLQNCKQNKILVPFPVGYVDPEFAASMFLSQKPLAKHRRLIWNSHSTKIYQTCHMFPEILSFRQNHDLICAKS